MARKPWTPGLLQWCYRALILMASLAVAVGLATAAPARAATSAPSASLGTMKAIAAGAARAAAAAAVTPPSGNVTFDVDPGISVDKATLQEAVAQVQGDSGRLSDGFKRVFEGYDDTSASDAQAPEFSAANDWQDFDGTLAIDSDGTGVSVTIPASEVQTAATFWQNVVALAVAGTVTIIVRAACVAGIALYLTPAAIGVVGKTLCAGLGNFLGVFVRGWILQAFDGTLGDATQWGETIAEAVLAAVGPSLWEAGINRFAENTLPGFFTAIYNWTVNTFIPAVGWLGTTILNGIKSAATFLYNVGAGLANAVRNLSTPTSPGAGGESCDIYGFGRHAVRGGLQHGAGPVRHL